MQQEFGMKDTACLSIGWSTAPLPLPTGRSRHQQLLVELQLPPALSSAVSRTFIISIDHANLCFRETRTFMNSSCHASRAGIFLLATYFAKLIPWCCVLSENDRDFVAVVLEPLKSREHHEKYQVAQVDKFLENVHAS